MDRNEQPDAVGSYDRWVALRTEGVDRNPMPLMMVAPRLVALRTEGVDRNSNFFTARPASMVALRTEGVDRNR